MAVGSWPQIWCTVVWSPEIRLGRRSLRVAIESWFRWFQRASTCCSWRYIHMQIIVALRLWRTVGVAIKIGHVLLDLSLPTSSQGLRLLLNDRLLLGRSKTKLRWHLASGSRLRSLRIVLLAMKRNIERSDSVAYRHCPLPSSRGWSSWRVQCQTRSICRRGH